MNAESLSTVYAGLAEAFSYKDGLGLPEWLTAPGREWPVFEPAVCLTTEEKNHPLNQAITLMEDIEATQMNNRVSEFQTLFIGTKSPPVWLYESYYLGGRVPGWSTFQVQELYRKAGLEVIGSELPDHASMELSFLAYLAEQEASGTPSGQTWCDARLLFLEHHVSRWMPAVGRELTKSPYPAWVAIGHLLVAVLKPDCSQTDSHSSPEVVPEITEKELCNLCGFCVQVCPTGALTISENETTTELWLQTERCIQCQKCLQICMQHCITLVPQHIQLCTAMLRSSIRAVCPQCGTRTVSEAEFITVAARLGGNPTWLKKCGLCRSS